jgi:hypothetical protein
MCLLEHTHTHALLVAAPRLGAACLLLGSPIPLDVGREVTGSGLGGQPPGAG